ncbi:hypothetical protein V498_08506 [Pseudogymnoascus sp. VKM F-4517 (FW-2822)]|nr:hypothetical protein V498_08506 [Pseudogymnoascus sp. VKM F-4517 (FW-2822)]
MVHLYGCTICEEKIPAEDNRIHCRDCGSEICGSCYLRKKTSHFHKADHQNYMIAEYSGSMYVQPPAPPTRVAQRANGATKTTKTTKTTKKAKSAAASTKSVGVKRKRLEDDHVYVSTPYDPILFKCSFCN